MFKLIVTLLAALAVSAQAQDITGAGATFPAPLYAKWADAYRKDKTVPELDDKLYVDTATPVAKFIFWGLAAVILLSLLIA